MQNSNKIIVENLFIMEILTQFLRIWIRLFSEHDDFNRKLLNIPIKRSRFLLKLNNEDFF